jgi:hypothetical protein
MDWERQPRWYPELLLVQVPQPLLLLAEQEGVFGW